MTLKDIAEKAGVSMMTVSNVINGKHRRVSAQTIERVNAIIDQYGYVPNLNARSLMSKSSRIIGIIISWDEGNDTQNHLENPYVSTMIGTIERELRLNGYYTLVRSVFKRQDLTVLLKNWNVDGMIFLYPSCDSYLETFLESAPCPVAVFDSSINAPELINICSDDETGLYLATKYMINHGHTHIAFVADPAISPILQKRFSGYRKALEENGIPFRPEYVYPVPPSYEGGMDAGGQLAITENDISAAVTTADICAVGVMEGARLGGYRIPVDLSIIGYDDLALCRYTMPKLTSVSQNIPKKAVLATRLLLEKIKTGQTSGPSNIQTAVCIKERQSVVSIF